MTTILSAAIALAQVAAPVTAEMTRHGFDADRLAAAHRLLVANGSDASRRERVESAARALLAAPLTACLDKAADRAKKVDCSALGERIQADVDRLPAILPSLVDEVGAIEERAYAERFTASELDDIARFAGSDVGRKLARNVDAVALELRLGARDLLFYTLRHTSATDSRP